MREQELPTPKTEVKYAEVAQSHGSRKELDALDMVHVEVQFGQEVELRLVHETRKSFQ
jgi:hypothetical protein